jgi:hypothetical protein
MQLLYTYFAYDVCIRTASTTYFHSYLVPVQYNPFCIQSRLGIETSLHTNIQLTDHFLDGS